MGVFIALLRGINVSGKNIIKMAELKKSFEDTELHQLQTYLQSGNLVFKTDLTDTSVLSDLISGIIFKDFGLEVKVKVLTAVQLQGYYEENPFFDQPDIELKQLYYIHTLGKIDAAAISDIQSIDGISEELSFADEIIYVNYNNGYGKSKITHKFFERKLKIPVTARNNNTMKKLAEIATQMSA